MLIESLNPAVYCELGSRSVDPIRMFLNSVGYRRGSILPPEEEQNLFGRLNEIHKLSDFLPVHRSKKREEIDNALYNWFEAIKSEGKEDIILTLIGVNQGLVLKALNKYKFLLCTTCSDEYDLFQIGNIALIRAIAAFDPNRGTKFSSLAHRRVQTAIIREIGNTHAGERIPNHVIEIDFPAFDQAVAELEQKLGRVPEKLEIIDYLQKIDWQDKRITRIMDALNLRIRTKGPPQEEEDPDKEDRQNYKMDLRRGNGQRPIEEEVFSRRKSEVAENLAQKLEACGLNYKEEIVIRWRFGLNGYGESTLQKIANKLGITRERVRQIEQEAKGKIRQSSAAQAMAEKYFNSI